MDTIRGKTLILGLVIVVLNYTFVICDGIRWTRYSYNGNTGHKHVETREKVFTAEVKDPISCAKLCHFNGACKSFAFDAETSKCSGCATLHCDEEAETPEDLASSLFFTTAESVSVRLSGGNSSHEGRLEVFKNGQWGSVCNDNFGTNEAMVACKMQNLTWKNAQTYPSSLYNESILPILLGNVSCSGSENSMFECWHRAWGEVDCRHGEKVAMSCPPVSTVRLNKQENDHSGEIEVLHKNEWTRVCADSVDKEKAMIICNMLTPSWNVTDVQIGSFSRSSKAGRLIRLDDFSCTGSEGSLSECPHYFMGENTCKAERTVTISCEHMLHIRLGDENSSGQRRVEVSKDGKEWGTICRYDFIDMTSKVVCRMLGNQSSGQDGVTVTEDFGAFVFNHMSCNGEEDSLMLCKYILDEKCSTKEVITVECP